MKLAGSSNMKAFVLGGVLVSAIAIAAIAPAVASGGHGGKAGGPRMMPEFSVLDLNGDGQITTEEFLEQREARFASADTDGDGLLSLDELTARAAGKAQERAMRGVARMLERRDTNGDGLLSAEEMQPRGEGTGQFFARMDTNEDGMISEEEFETAIALMAERRRGQGNGSQSGHGYGQGGSVNDG